MAESPNGMVVGLVVLGLAGVLAVALAQAGFFDLPLVRAVLEALASLDG